LKNSGSDWTPKGKPTEVKVYDFIDIDLGKAIPDKIYDIKTTKGGLVLELIIILLPLHLHQ
jgi:hypothetical protein